MQKNERLGKLDDQTTFRNYVMTKTIFRTLLNWPLCCSGVSWESKARGDVYRNAHIENFKGVYSRQSTVYVEKRNEKRKSMEGSERMRGDKGKQSI